MKRAAAEKRTRQRENTASSLRLGPWVRRMAGRLARAGVEQPLLEARVLAGAALHLDPSLMFLHKDRPLQREDVRRTAEFLARRLKREPLAYITGNVEFWSLTFEVGPGVLIPRPETEHLVEISLRVLREARRGSPGRPLYVADLGTGSGAIAVALARELPDLRVTAVDCSERALAVARRNAQRWGVSDRILFVRGSWCRPLQNGFHPRFDWIVSNPPYVSEEEFPHLEPDVRCYEPREALLAAGDPLHNYRNILRDLPAVLRPGGGVAFEVAPHRAEAVARWLRELGWTRIVIAPDYAGRPRVVTGVVAASV